MHLWFLFIDLINWNSGLIIQSLFDINAGLEFLSYNEGRGGVFGSSCSIEGSKKFYRLKFFKQQYFKLRCI